jgi:ornithine cyclodeaminase/alanine dehydrogenase-like protein (mu-crystallin family)
MLSQGVMDPQTGAVTLIFQASFITQVRPDTAAVASVEQ